MPPVPASVFTRSIFETKLKAMVFCRGIACFLGYPIKYDPTFTNHHLLGVFLEAILSYADNDCLWDFNATDLSTVFAPLLDYADIVTGVQKNGGTSDNPLASLSLSSIEWMQKKFTFNEASDMAEELDGLAGSSGNGTVWVKWFEFVRYSELIHAKEHQLRDSTWYPWVRTRIIGMMMMRPMEPDVAEQQFFLTCCKLHEYLPANDNYKGRIAEVFSESNATHLKPLANPTSLASLVKLRLPTVGELMDTQTPDDASNHSWSVSLDTSASKSSIEPPLLRKWTFPAEFVPEMYTPHPISTLMSKLLDGSIPEPRESNWSRKNITYW